MKGKLILKGISASPGIFTGKVRLILDPSNCAIMKKGEVLVTEMTNPFYMPAINKAGAIITDVGGLLCHAAITSRELKIPCIVCTKKGTKILRNGEAIIVDADRGEIREA